MSTPKKDKIIAAYQAWDPEKETVDKLAQRLGVSRTHLYKVLREAGVPTKTGRQVRVIAPDDSLMQAMADNALAYLFTRLSKAERTNEEYRELMAREMELLLDAWAVIANAGWDGSDKTEGWQEAAEQWREAFHARLAEYFERTAKDPEAWVDDNRSGEDQPEPDPEEE